MKDALKRFLAVASLVGLPCLAVAQSPDQPPGAGQPEAGKTDIGAMGQSQLNWAICPSPKGSLRGTQGSLDKSMDDAGAIDRSAEMSGTSGGDVSSGGSGALPGGPDTSAKNDKGMSSDDLHRDMSGSPDQAGQQDQTGVGAMSSPMGGDMITQIENSLSEKKLYKKGISPNGVLDKADFDAIKKFQTTKKISPATGCIDQQLSLIHI